MKRLIFLSIVLAASLAHARQPTPCLKLSHVKVDRKVLYQDGTAEVRLNFKARDCYVLSESVALGQQRPIVELQNEPGLKTLVGAIGAFRFDPDTAGATIFRAREITATLNLTATQEATLGQRKIPGTVRYKVVDRRGMSRMRFYHSIFPSKWNVPSPFPGLPGSWIAILSGPRPCCCHWQSLQRLRSCRW